MGSAAKATRKQRVLHHLALGAALSAILMLPGASPALAAVERPFPVVTVSGEGSTNAVPDLAVATVGVSSEAKSPREASEANARQMSAVIEAAKQAGIPENDIHTTRFAITPVYSQRNNAAGKPQLVGYRCSNQAQVKVRDQARAGEVLDLLVAAGANEVAGLAFLVSEPEKLLDTARQAAIANAKHKAALYAEAAGAQLGRAVSITEQSGNYYPSAPTFRAEATPPPISPGEQSLRVQVSVTFELLH